MINHDIRLSPIECKEIAIQVIIVSTLIGCGAIVTAMGAMYQQSNKLGLKIGSRAMIVLGVFAIFAGFYRLVCPSQGRHDQCSTGDTLNEKEISASFNGIAA